MGLFGNKDDDKKKKNLGAEEADDRLLAAIDEAEAEMEQDKADKVTARKEAIAKQALEEEEIKAKIEKAKVNILKNLPNDGRRAYMMVTECVEATEEFVKVKGKLFNEVHVDDTLYIYRPGGTVMEAKCTKLEPVAEEIAEDNVPENVPAAKNCPVVMTLAIDAIRAKVVPSNVAPFCSVVASVKPQTVVDKNTPVENPALLGMTLRYGDYVKDKFYMSTLFKHVAAARFIVPAHVDESVIGDNGKKALKIIAVENNGRRALPVFTDLPSLTAWKELFEDKANKPQIIVMSFGEAVKMTEKDELNIVINPRGPIAIELPRDLLKTMVERLGVGKKAKYTKETITDEAHKIAVGEVPSSPESDNVKNAIKAYGAAHSEITSIGLLAMRRNGKNGYLVIVDCPKSVSREIFADIKAACDPYMFAIKEMNFSLYAETMFADQYFADHTFTYVKNPNI